MPLVHCLTGDDGLKLLEDESSETESSFDSDESDDSVCNLLDHDDGWDSDCLNSQLDDGDLGVVEDIEMSSPSPPEQSIKVCKYMLRNGVGKVVANYMFTISKPTPFTSLR